MIQNGKSIKVGFTIKATEACPNLDYNYGLYCESLGVTYSEETGTFVKA